MKKLKYLISQFAFRLFFWISRLLFMNTDAIDHIFLSVYWWTWLNILKRCILPIYSSRVLSNTSTSLSMYFMHKYLRVSHSFSSELLCYYTWFAWVVSIFQGFIKKSGCMSLYVSITSLISPRKCWHRIWYTFLWHCGGLLSLIVMPKKKFKFHIFRNLQSEQISHTISQSLFSLT